MKQRHAVVIAFVMLMSASSSAQYFGGPGTGKTCGPGDENDRQCKPGESFIGAVYDVGNVAVAPTSDDPPCVGSRHAVLAAYMKDISKDSSATAEILEQLVARIPGPIGGLFGNDRSNCKDLLVRVPAGKTISRIHMTVSANGIPGNCALIEVRRLSAGWQFRVTDPTTLAATSGWTPLDQMRARCGAYKGAGGANFLAYCSWGGLEIGEDNRTVGVTFANWSDSQTRTPFLRVYYR